MARSSHPDGRHPDGMGTAKDHSPGKSRIISKVPGKMLKMLTLLLPDSPESGKTSPGDDESLPSGSPPGRSASVSDPESGTGSLASSEEQTPSKEQGTTANKKKKKKFGKKLLKAISKGRKPREKPMEVEQENKRQTMTAEEIKEDIQNKRLEVARHLLALERELNRPVDGRSEEELIRDLSKVEALYELLKGQVLAVVGDALAVAKTDPRRLHQAAEVIAQQEEEDRRYAAEGASSPAGKLVKTRPRGWQQLWREAVRKSVEERMVRPAAAAGREGLSEAAQSFLHMGLTMKDDLLVVAGQVRQHFPEEFDVFHTYAACYHSYFSAQMTLMAQFELGDNDTYLLLSWVQSLYPKEILNHPGLAGELKGAGFDSLLPPRQIRQLEATFLSNEKASVHLLMAKGLEVEVKHWSEDKSPEKLDGHFHSELPIDIIQIMSSRQKKAEDLSAELGKQMKHMLLIELPEFLRSYQTAFEDFREKCKQQKNYKAIVIANINNCLAFRDYIDRITSSLEKTPPAYIFTPLVDVENSGFEVLLQDLFLELKPLFKRLKQNKWTASEGTLEDILRTAGEHIPEFTTLLAHYHQIIMERIHLHLVKEYVMRLCKKRFVLKSLDQQQQLAKQITSNSKALQEFCMENGSPGSWLEPVLRSLAEIIRLQDLSAIQMEVATFVQRYPDFSKAHLGAILSIKGNLSSSDVKSIKSILEVSPKPTDSSKALFSFIKVG
ncbi:tumor necrosis factor alpha-induced protein 2 isoform X1 [Ornithorhynchus anatinus]|uniref:tumor necrosis factor alpha-induced protein 2 isoform X1 n=2 Tax=Ornithorhynchus anatinus TaxID=9258 RepID=UPI0010A7D6AC|nr:tumor necrosis factor alpha-induced protein 2 isoform X1 [Ornithorhynchus anatinus]XP_028924414.1 tumor necrosis factor alpha-induced protein 2 isoform X1 [Ornithorhynchus anatinus]